MTLIYYMCPAGTTPGPSDPHLIVIVIILTSGGRSNTSRRTSILLIPSTNTTAGVCQACSRPARRASASATSPAWSTRSVAAIYRCAPALLVAAICMRLCVCSVSRKVPAAPTTKRYCVRARRFMCVRARVCMPNLGLFHHFRGYFEA